MSDPIALREALAGASVVAHSVEESDLASSETGVDHLQATAVLIDAMKKTGIRRIIYLSRLGALRTSAYPTARLRGEAEALITASGLDYTIIQASISYGEEDILTNVVAMIAKTLPILLPIPDTGMTHFQPIWIDDLARCVIAATMGRNLIGQTVPVGGPEHFTYPQMMAQVLDALGIHRSIRPIRMGLVRQISQILNPFVVRNPIPIWWLDMLDAGQATELRAVRNHFGFEPCQFSNCLQYLRRKRPWRRELFRYLFSNR